MIGHCEVEFTVDGRTVVADLLRRAVAGASSTSGPS